MRFLLIAILTLGLTVACDNDNKFMPDSAVKAAFETYFPDASGEYWISKTGYSVVKFFHKGTHKLAWFSEQGVLEQVETDIPVHQLPEVIKQLIAASEYANWKIDDVDLVEGNGMEPVYIVEMESGEQEVDLYFAEDGTLIKVVIDTDDDDNDICPIAPNPANQKIRDIVFEKYPGAKILEIDKEGKKYEIDLYFEGAYYEMSLNAQLEWIETSREITWNSVPEAVKKTFKSAGYVFNPKEDDVDLLYRPGAQTDLVLYRIELDRENSADLVLYYTEDGNIFS